MCFRYSIRLCLIYRYTLKFESKIGQTRKWASRTCCVTIQSHSVTSKYYQEGFQFRAKYDALIGSFLKTNPSLALMAGKFNLTARILFKVNHHIKLPVIFMARFDINLLNIAINLFFQGECKIKSSVPQCHWFNFG